MNPTGSEYVAALKRDRQSWLLVEQCLRAELVVTPYGECMHGLYRLPAQGLDRRRMEAAASRLQALYGGPAARCRRAPRPRAAPSQLVLMEQVALELADLRDGVGTGARLLYNELPVHSLGVTSPGHASPTGVNCWPV